MAFEHLGHSGGVALLSNGASRLVDPYALVDWADAMRLIGDSGPEGFLAGLRAAEAGTASHQLPFATSHASDDATVAFVRTS